MDNNNNKSLIKVNNKLKNINEEKKDNNEIDNEEQKEQKEYTEFTKHNNEDEVKYSSPEKKDKNTSGIIIAILAIVILIGILFAGYRQITTGTVTYNTEKAQDVISEKENPTLKAEKLDPQKVYNLKDTSDVLNNMELTIKKAQFRKDQTRIWIHLKNSGGEKINMMPNVNSTLVDNNGHSYKVDSFAGDQVTSVAPGTDEDIMLVFEPIRADAKSITYNLDSVFDLKNTSWKYNITVNLP